MVNKPSEGSQRRLEHFGKEGSESETLRHVPTSTLLLLLVESEVYPGNGCTAEGEPEKGVGDHFTQGKD